ncbi:MAG TPA: DUF488 domain-containing protein [Steroidobacteraceae bacterium]
MNDEAHMLWSIGHSTRTLEEFLGLLATYGIETVADVRSFPGSRRYPHFGRAELAAALAGRALEYQWLPALGGRRRARPDSPNTGWRNASFRGYADYMASAEFACGLTQLMALAARARTVVMCSEALWWRCHRSLIADALTLRHYEVMHILDAKHAVPHPMSSPARIVRGELTYAQPGPEPAA